VVEHFTHYAKIEGLTPAAGIGREKMGKLVLFKKANSRGTVARFITTLSLMTLSVKTPTVWRHDTQRILPDNTRSIVG